MDYKDLRVLITDDSSGVRVLTEKVLNSFGITKIMHAANGREAIVRLEQAVEAGEAFDLVLCDLNMPVIDGQGLLKRVKESQLPKVSSVMFIVVTAESDKETVLDLIKTGIDGFIIKPVVRKDLFHKLNDVFKRRGRAEMPASVLMNKI